MLFLANLAPLVFIYFGALDRKMSDPWIQVTLALSGLFIVAGLLKFTQSNPDLYSKSVDYFTENIFVVPIIGVLVSCLYLCLRALNLYGIIVCLVLLAIFVMSVLTAYRKPSQADKSLEPQEPKENF